MYPRSLPSCSIASLVVENSAAVASSQVPASLIKCKDAVSTPSSDSCQEQLGFSPDSIGASGFETQSSLCSPFLSLLSALNSFGLKYQECHIISGVDTNRYRCEWQFYKIYKKKVPISKAGTSFWYYLSEAWRIWEMGRVKEQLCDFRQLKLFFRTNLPKSRVKT